jgi:hypothetical protein
VGLIYEKTNGKKSRDTGPLSLDPSKLHLNTSLDKSFFVNKFKLKLKNRAKFKFGSPLLEKMQPKQLIYHKIKILENFYLCI